MPKSTSELPEAAKYTGGNAWRKATGQRSTGLTLPAADAVAIGQVAAAFDLSTAELFRRLARWAIKTQKGTDLGLKRILGKIAETD